jgi:2-keto-4-pentenoate hydratase/2-oxohepta-3-ene-1,7-dioic acid hydratase in catechol pathway
MRYVTFSLPSDRGTRLGVVHADRVVDLQSLSSPTGAGQLPSNFTELVNMGPDHWRRIGTVLQTELPRLDDGARFRFNEIRWHAPCPKPVKNIFCLGLNYASHAAESAKSRGKEVKIPTSPVFFTKAPTTVNGPFEDVPLHRRVTEQMDWEVELGVIIGRTGRNISKAKALEHVFGYTVINDFTARDLQGKHLQWFKGKSLDGSCPMGPVVVTADEFGNPQAKQVTLRVNGVTKQDANTKDMIFPVDTIIEILSAGMTLEAGDIISTGTPEGVGMGRTPQEFLKDGDIVETEVESIGVMRNKIVATD